MKLGWIALGALSSLAACGDDLGSPQCDEAGIACTWAGMAGEVGFNGDGHDRKSTMLYWTMDMVWADDGRVYFIDWNNHLVRRVETDDTVTSLIGWTDPVFPGDGTLPPAAERTPEGVPGTEVQLNHPTDLALTDDGQLLVMAWHNHKLRELDPDTGNVRILGGAGGGFAGDNGPLAMAVFKQPKALERAADGTLYILDQQNFRIRKVAPDGVITTIAGNGMQQSAGDGGEALAASLFFEAGSNPEPSGGLALSPDGARLYVAETMSSRIRVIDLEAGTIDAVAGTGDAGFGGDGGDALDARLNHPRAMAFGPDGDLYVADADNHRIRAIDLDTGLIRTAAGTGEPGLDEIGGLPAEETMLSRPFGVDFDPDGNMFISDTLNSRIVEVKR